jgi:hypothetical protein
VRVPARPVPELVRLQPVRRKETAQIHHFVKTRIVPSEMAGEYGRYAARVALQPASTPGRVVWDVPGAFPMGALHSGRTLEGTRRRIPRARTLWLAMFAGGACRTLRFPSVSLPYKRRRAGPPAGAFVTNAGGGGTEQTQHTQQRLILHRHTVM